MKLTDFSKTDQAILEAMKSHQGIDRAIKLNTLERQLNLTGRGLQARIERLQSMGCAIGSVDDGYFIPTSEEERRLGILKKMRTGSSISRAVDGYNLAELDWLEQLEDTE
ncbi:hypothetical protein GHK52_02180 [Lactococcus garvieae]|nr:hypothetical protein [Lactococcus garvieae]